MTNQSVSIIIPVYNVAPHLENCLDSIISQTFKNLEIIIINDCSTDGSGDIIKKYSEKDTRLKIINFEKNTGLGNARNTGLKAACGKYVVFVDGDDWIDKNHIEILHNAIEKNGCDLIMATHYTFDNTTKKIKLFKQKKEFYNMPIDSVSQKQKVLTLRMIWSVWNKIYDRNFLLKNDIYFKTNKMEDILFIYEVILKSAGFTFIKDATYYYRINRKNSIMSNKTDRIYNCIKAASEVKKFLKSQNLFETYKKSFYPYIALLFAAEFEVSSLSSGHLAKISSIIKRVFFNAMDIPFYKTYDKFSYKIRLFCFYICLKYGINYAVIGRFLRKTYNFCAEFFTFWKGKSSDL